MSLTKGLCWVLIGVLCCSWFGAACAQEPNGVKVVSPGSKLGTERSEVRALLNKLCVAVGVVLVLGGVAIYLLRVVVPRMGPMSTKRVKVVEVHHLGGRKVIHLIEVGHRQLLVGSTPTQIAMLADVTQHWDEPESMVSFAETGDQS